jgi:hypothetical protein
MPGAPRINLLEINNAYIRTKGTVWAESHGELPLRVLHCVSVPDANGQDVFLYVKVQIADALEHAIVQGHVGIDVACLFNFPKAHAPLPIKLVARDAWFRRFARHVEAKDCAPLL